MESKKLVVFFVLIFLISFISAECLEGQMNINTASLDELDELYGIGPVKAQAIIDARPFESLDNLIDVYGIGPATLEGIKSQGLACVDNEKDAESEEEKEKDNETNENKVVYVNLSRDTNNEITTKTINLNPKDINTESSGLFKGKYALIGLIIFSVIIVFLLLLKYKTQDKNEFR